MPNDDVPNSVTAILMLKKLPFLVCLIVVHGSYSIVGTTRNVWIWYIFFLVGATDTDLLPKCGTVANHSESNVKKYHLGILPFK